MRAAARLDAPAVLALLEQGPRRLAAAADGVAADRLQAPPEPDAWSAVEVLSHLRACADVWGGCIDAILRGEATLRAVNPRTWITSTDYLDLPYDRSLRAFRDQRSRLLGSLEALDDEAWSRTATVTGAGRPLERSVHFYAQWLATHERPHLEQVRRAVRQLGA